MPDLLICARCQRLEYVPDGGWTVELEDGYPAAVLCTDCRRPEEDAEAEHNSEAVVMTSLDSSGRMVAVMRDDPLLSEPGPDSEASHHHRLAQAHRILRALEQGVPEADVLRDFLGDDGKVVPEPEDIAAVARAYQRQA